MDMARDPPRVEGMRRETKILLIEDDPEDARYVRELLSEEMDCPFKVEQAGKLSEGIDRLSKGGIDIVLLDLGLPDSLGLETMVKMRPYSYRVPVVVLSGLEDIQIGVKSIQEGAQDFIVKSHLDRDHLTRSILHAIRRLTMRETLRSAEPRETESVEVARDLILHLLSHELRRPLSVIQGVVDHLKEGQAGPLTDDQREYVEMAAQQVVGINNVLSGLLDLSQIHFGKPKLAPTRVDPHEFVGGSEVSVPKKTGGKKIRIEEDIPPNLPKIYADGPMIAQVLSRLLNRAFDLSLEKIILRARAVDDAFANDPNPSVRAGVRFSVITDGSGMPSEDLGALFNPFTRLHRSGAGTSVKGIGMGLTICKKIVELHGGKIWAEGGPDRGVAFHFVIPCFDEEAHFRLAFSESLKNAEGKSRLTVMVLSVANLEQIKSLCSEDEIEKMYHGFEERVGSVLRTVDSVCRLKGRLVIFAHASLEESRMIRLRVLQRVSDCSCSTRLGKVPLICRIGMAVYGEDGMNPEELFFHAATKSEPR